MCSKWLKILIFLRCRRRRLSLSGSELLANSAKATGGEDVTCRSGMCVDVTSSPSPRSPRGKTPAGQTLLDNSSVGNTHFPWIAGAREGGESRRPAGEGWRDSGLGVCLLCVAFHSMKLEYSFVSLEQWPCQRRGQMISQLFDFRGYVGQPCKREVVNEISLFLLLLDCQIKWRKCSFMLLGCFSWGKRPHMSLNFFKEHPNVSNCDQTPTF